MQIARGIQVPLKADSVQSPEIYYGRDDGLPCLIFWLADGPGEVGRVTFEGFDAIRCCRGEYLPYDNDWTGEDYSRYPWVFEVEDSSWLRERHEYEFKHYQTSLLDEYVHYLFSFHDEYVELIAKGIWFEAMDYAQVHEPPQDHPLQPPRDWAPVENFVVEGITCSVRHNPLSREELVGRSKLCSQILFQYDLTLDGDTKPSYAGMLRTIRGKPVTRLQGGLFYRELLAVEGVGAESGFRPAFSNYVAEVAERRRQMGKDP